MKSKKEYQRPRIKVVNIGYGDIICSSYMEEGIGDGGGPRARMNYNSFDFEEDHE